MRVFKKLIIYQIVQLSIIGAAYAAPVIPNKAIVVGTVEEFCITSSKQMGVKPQQALYKFLISIEKTEDVAGSPNFVKSRAVQSLTAYSKERQPADLYGKKVKAIVEFRGDERGGLFWIRQIEIIDHDKGEK